MAHLFALMANRGQCAKIVVALQFARTGNVDVNVRNAGVLQSVVMVKGRRYVLSVGGGRFVRTEGRNGSAKNVVALQFAATAG